MAATRPGSPRHAAVPHEPAYGPMRRASSARA
jgi:hypothetical protein